MSLVLIGLKRRQTCDDHQLWFPKILLEEPDCCLDFLLRSPLVGALVPLDGDGGTRAAGLNPEQAEEAVTPAGGGGVHEDGWMDGQMDQGGVSHRKCCVIWAAGGRCDH